MSVFPVQPFTYQPDLQCGIVSDVTSAFLCFSQLTFEARGKL